MGVVGWQYGGGRLLGKLCNNKDVMNCRFPVAVRQGLSAASVLESVIAGVFFSGWTSAFPVCRVDRQCEVVKGCAWGWGTVAQREANLLYLYILLSIVRLWNGKGTVGGRSCYIGMVFGWVNFSIGIKNGWGFIWLSSPFCTGRKVDVSRLCFSDFLPVVMIAHTTISLFQIGLCWVAETCYTSYHRHIPDSGTCTSSENTMLSITQIFAGRRRNCEKVISEQVQTNRDSSAKAAIPLGY